MPCIVNFLGLYLLCMQENIFKLKPSELRQRELGEYEVREGEMKKGQKKKEKEFLAGVGFEPTSSK